MSHAFQKSAEYIANEFALVSFANSFVAKDPMRIARRRSDVRKTSLRLRKVDVQLHEPIEDGLRNICEPVAIGEEE
jgi:hypothetical protein